MLHSNAGLNKVATILRVEKSMATCQAYHGNGTQIIYEGTPRLNVLDHHHYRCQTLRQLVDSILTRRR